MDARLGGAAHGLDSNLIGLDDFNLDRIGDPLRCVHLHWSVAVYRAEHCSAHDLRR